MLVVVSDWSSSEYLYHAYHEVRAFSNQTNNKNHHAKILTNLYFFLEFYWLTCDIKKFHFTFAHFRLTYVRFPAHNATQGNYIFRSAALSIVKLLKRESLQWVFFAGVLMQCFIDLSDNKTYFITWESRASQGIQHNLKQPLSIYQTFTFCNTFHFSDIETDFIPWESMEKTLSCQVNLRQNNSRHIQY